VTADDVLGTEGRSTPRAVRVAGVAVAGLAVAAVVGNGLASRHESDALRSCVTTSESDLTDLGKRAEGVESYVSPLLRTPGVAPGVRDSVAEAVQQTVAKDLPRTVKDRRACAGVHVLPWHSEVADARADYVRWLDLRIEQLRAATTDVDALHQSRSVVVQARKRAVTSLSRQDVTITP
jgi:hypothetical protein